MDPRFIRFVQWLTLNPSGPVAAHVMARGFITGVVDSAGNFTPTISVCDGAQIKSPGETYIGAPQSWASAPPELAVQALAGDSFDWLNVSVLNFGPNVTLGEVASAITASGV